MGRNKTDFADMLFVVCGSAMKDELEKVNYGESIIKICIPRLRSDKSILSRNYFASMLNDDTLKGRQMRHQD